LLAAGYFELGQLTAKIGSQPEALAMHRKGLAVRRELAVDGADRVGALLDVARSLQAVGHLLGATGDTAGALAAYEEQRDIAAALEAESPTDTIRAVLADSQFDIGVISEHTGKPTEALAAYRKALVLRQRLADANPAATAFQRDLAQGHHNIGFVLMQTGKPAEGLAAYREALAIQQRLADANPAVADFQSDLAQTHHTMGYALAQLGKPADALAAYRQSLALRQKVVETYPAVTAFQRDLARSHHNIGYMLWRTDKPADALAAFQQSLTLQQKLAEANPAVNALQRELAQSHFNIGNLLLDMGKPTEARAACQQSLAIRQKLAEASPTIPDYQAELALSLSRLGISHRRSGRHADATASFRQAVAILERLPTLTPCNYYNLSCFRALLAGGTGDAGSGLTVADGRAVADQAMDALRRAVAAGFSNVGIMRVDTDLEALRSREDFRQLLKELEATIVKGAPAGAGPPEPKKQ
jgi:tetratricopeptide (TPR) repeat protein